MDKLPYLNLGCGATFHKDWTNIDFVSSGTGVIAHNLLVGIPFPDNSFEVIYHSHVLEHFPKAKAEDFIKECYRVLNPGGMIRIAVPDLEAIALNYINYLNESLAGTKGAAEKYDWTMLELFDQVVRSGTGGEMIDYIKDTSKNNDAFLLERNGYEVKRIMEIFRSAPQPPAATVSFSMSKKLKGLKNKVQTKFISLVLGKDYAAYRTGKFRLEGEIHQWMYDRYSLKRLLENSGFKNAEVKIGFESGIPEWKKYNLDGKDNVLRKPDSLFMEATK
ncbi:MAG: methyltransferase domain-containing protein [Bacteroidetes bacterium]|nr:methyltransferase domain-containing protein [Bacteroidota bacterium]